MVLRRLLPFTLFVPLFASAASPKKAITIDTLLEHRPERSGLDAAWSPDGTKFLTAKDKVLTEYDVASGKRRNVVSLDKLREQSAAPAENGTFDWTNRRVAGKPVQWFPDGRHILVAERGDLYVVDAGSGETKALTHTPEEEFDPKLSPDGHLVAFRREHDLYTLDLDSKKLCRLTHDGSDTLLNGELDWVYPEELELETAYWWSPDSRSVAYLQMDTAREPVFPQVSLLKARGVLEPERYPKAGDPNADVRVGVVSAKGGHTTWMDAGEPRDRLLARIAWTPDSHQVAIVRLPRIQNELDVLLADATTGQAHTLLHESDRYWLNVSEPPRFLPDGRMLWTSEHSGFRHLYLYGRDGALQRQLTSGEWQVERIEAVDEQRGKILYLSTEGSPLERHAYSIDLDGSSKQNLTPERGTHAISAAKDGAHFLDRFSSLDALPQTVLRNTEGKSVGTYEEADTKWTEQYQVLPTEIVQVHASDGTLLYARLIKPANFAAGKQYPAVVMVYGGPHAQSVQERWAGASWDQVLAHQGFVIWQLDNRGSYGRGHAFEAAVSRRLGEQELADQKTGIEHLISLGFVDRHRIGLYGWSYGGFMTLYTVTHAPDLIHAAIAGAPVTNWHNYDSIYTERYMDLPQTNLKGYDLYSPLPAADKLQAKLLLIHNIEDDNVHFANSMQVAEALEKAGKPFRMLVYPQRTHGVTGEYRKHLLEETTSFFVDNLK